MVECARERHIEKSRPRRGAAHFQEDDELDDQTKQGQIVRQMDLPGLLVRLQSQGTRFMVPKIIKKVDPRISAAQLQKAVMNHDVNMLYRTVDVCSKCAEKIGQTSEHFDQGTEPRKTLSSMSFQHDVEGDENGQGNT